MQDISSAILKFNTIGLEQTNENASLQERIDTKYVLSLNTVPEILDACKEHYYIQEINGERVSKYETTYFDTHDLHFYHAHHAGHANRIKIRVRQYLNTGACYLEVKQKTNKGITKKTRAIFDKAYNSIASSLEDDVFDVSARLFKNELEQKAIITYNRITLISKLTLERVTIDCNVTFIKDSRAVLFEDFAIAEIKQANKSQSFFISLMKAQGLREGSISKYCLGIISLYDKVKQNRFKPSLHLLNKKSLSHGNAPIFC